MKDIFEDIANMQQNIQPLNINGLKGRLLRIPSAKKTRKREILLIYGHHSSLERMYGVAEAFADYGNVAVPDLPGFGGMDSFYKIGMKPTIDNMADYLATFVKLKYRNKKVTIIGMSMGFVIATRMLQKYPDLANKVNLLVSLVGFTHKNDYTFSRNRMFFYRASANVLSKRIPSILFYNIALHPTMLRSLYSRMHNAKNKFKHLDDKDKKQMIEFEVILWRENEVRTAALTSYEMLTLDNCKKQIDLPVYSVSVENDQYFDNATVEQHMRVIFTDFTDYRTKPPAHAPSIVATKSAAAPFMPTKLKRLLSK